MSPGRTSLTTERLVLRHWRPEDRAPFAALNADPEVMEYFPAPLSRAESDAYVDRIEATFADRGLGLWAVETGPSEPESGRFAGYVGLSPATFDAPFTPAMEVGWRLARWSWGRGYAPEAARATLADGFERLGLDEIVSFTAVINHRSRRVMEKIGLRHDSANDFDHPSLAAGHWLERHVLYRSTVDEWRLFTSAEGGAGR